MATDATGAPTPKGIPKFDDAQDAPSGLGSNAQMDAIDALLGWFKSRKNSGGTEFSRGRVNLIEGTGVTITMADDAVNNEVDVTIAAAAAAVPGYGTALPGSPTDGQEYILVDSVASPTYRWFFRYNASSGSAYKWEFVGGTPASIITPTAETRSSAGSYGDLATVGPTFTLPVAGDWDITADILVSTKVGDGHAFMSYAVGGVAASDDWAAGGFGWNGQAMGVSRTIRWVAVAASTVITAKYMFLTGTDATFKNRILRVMPVRVG